MRRKTALLRLGLAGLVGLLALGGKCRLGLQDTGTGPDTRPKRFCKSVTFVYERHQADRYAPSALQSCVILTLIELRPGQGEVKTDLYAGLPEQEGCSYPTSPGVVRLAPNRWSFTFRDVYMPYDDEYGNVLQIGDPATFDTHYEWLELPPEALPTGVQPYRGWPSLRFYLKEEGTCVGG